MKKLLLFLCFVLALANLKSQNYQLSFAGSGASSSVDSVKVENLTQDTTIKLAGNDILHLLGIIGIKEFKFQNSHFSIRPNPVTDYCNIEFDATVTANASIELYDITGKLILQSHNKLEQGRQSFMLSGLNSGVYFIQVKSEAYIYSGKLISKNNGTLNSKLTCNKLNDKVIIKNNTSLSYNKSKANTIEMQYNDGDLLKITGYSQNFGAIVMKTPAQNETITFPFYECKDADNKNYLVVEISSAKKSSKGTTQIWMAENINAGTMVSGLQNLSNNGIIEKVCLDGIEANCNLFGGLYNWDELMQYSVNPGSRGICPLGWHVPSATEWNILIEGLGGWDLAGGKMKETGYTHWNTPNTGATNSSGFTGLPTSSGSSCVFGSSTWHPYPFPNEVFGTNLSALTDDCEPWYDFNKTEAFAVRCIKTFEKVLPVVTTDSINKIKSTSAKISANVIYDGGDFIISRGFCCSLNPNPDLTNSLVFLAGSDAGLFSDNITGLSINTTYYVRAFATNSIGTAYGDELSFITTLGVGEPFQGGIIAYILQSWDPGYVDGEIHGIIAADADQDTTDWGCQSFLVGTTNTTIGSGKDNTTAIVNACSTPKIAALICDELVLNGFDDWYLPSKEELYQLFVSHYDIGGFGKFDYWSSSELDAENAWRLSFDNGTYNSNVKSDVAHFRPVRSF